MTLAGVIHEARVNVGLSYFRSVRFTPVLLWPVLLGEALTSNVVCVYQSPARETNNAGCLKHGIECGASSHN